MEGVTRVAMALSAIFLQGWLNQFMGKLANWAEWLYPPVVAVTGNAIILDQLLMK
jgi:hypothetical protein